MNNKKFVLWVGLCWAFIGGASFKAEPGDGILGKWMTVEKNLVVEVYKENQLFNAKILWFDDSDNPAEPMNTRLDDKNPDKMLRNRKVLGMEVVHGLTYNTRSHCWEDGKIYDAHNGRYWDSTVTLMKDHTMKVRGYWNFQLIGRNLFFKKI